MFKARVLLFLILFAGGADGAELRVGIIGTDTSHAVAFTKLLNDASDPDHVSGARVVAAYKGGSADVPASATRVDKFAGELGTHYKVEFVDSIPALCRRVDAVLLESVDGRVHLSQVKPVFEARKRVFIDKPLAVTLHDAEAIERLSRETGTPWFSASSVRFADEYRKIAGEMGPASILGAASFGPAHLEPTNPGLFWYGIHAVEALYMLMGTGCASVTATSNSDTDLVTGVWRDGRIGTIRGLRKGKQDFGLVVFGKSEVRYVPLVNDTYVPLVHEIVRFFQTGRVPVSNQETLETIAFMEAAEMSRLRGGVPVRLAEIGGSR